MKSEDSIFGANQQDEDDDSSSNHLNDKGLSEDNEDDDYDNEDEDIMSDSLFQKVMRMKDATSSQGAKSGSNQGGSTSRANAAQATENALLDSNDAFRTSKT